MSSKVSEKGKVSARKGWGSQLPNDRRGDDDGVSRKILFSWHESQDGVVFAVAIVLKCAFFGNVLDEAVVIVANELKLRCKRWAITIGMTELRDVPFLPIGGSKLGNTRARQVELYAMFRFVGIGIFKFGIIAIVLPKPHTRFLREENTMRRGNFQARLLELHATFRLVDISSTCKFRNVAVGLLKPHTGFLREENAMRRRSFQARSLELHAMFMLVDISGIRECRNVAIGLVKPHTGFVREENAEEELLHRPMGEF